MWLHVPISVLSACAPEEEDSTSDFDSLYQLLERSAMWKEKSLRPAFWRRALKRAPWTTRLSGLTCSPSTAERGAAAWIASLEGSPASRTPSPVSASESSTLETSGLPLPEWYSMLRQMSASSRTFQASLLTTTETYDPTYRPWVTKLRRASSQRRRSARLIFANGSTSWPSARAEDGESAGNHPGAVDSLTGAIQNWPTPTSAPEAPNTNSNTVNGPTPLGEAAQLWQTPTARDWKGKTNEGRNQPMLPDQIENWATPTAHDGRRPGPDTSSTQGRNLKREAEAFPPALATAQDGPNTSPPGDLRLLRPVLNPSFVEALMGWPGGLTDYTYWAMESFQSWQQKHLSVLRKSLEC